MLKLAFLQNELLCWLYMIIVAGLSSECRGHQLRAQELGDFAEDQANDTTPVPQEEIVSAAYWREVREQLWAKHNEEKQRFLQTTPKPVLDPWRDHQPYFTALGDAFLKDVTAIRTPPTQTPPPTQEFVNNVLWPACPEIKIPMKVRVEVPPCYATQGHWLDPFEDLASILTVESGGCSGLFLSTRMEPNSTLMAPVGTLQEEITVHGSTYDFKDCNGNAAFSISELLIRQGVEDDERRESHSYEFGLSQRSKVFLKYSIAQPNGEIMAETNIFPLGEDYFWWHRGNATDRVALPSSAVAGAQRVGFWKPKQCGNWTKAWTLQFNASERHANTVAEVHWRLALSSAMTILAWRDEQRSPDGLVRAYQACTVENAVIFWVVLCLIIFVPVAIFVWFAIRGAKEARMYCFELESWLMPHHMDKPSRGRKH